MTDDELKAAGFRSDGAHVVLRDWGPERNGTIQVYPDGRWFLNGTKIRPPATPGQMFQLLAALGITPQSSWSATVPPDRPGWWRWRDRPGGVPQVVRVERMRWSLAGRLAVRRMDGYGGFLESFGGEWAGPVEFPEE